MKILLISFLFICISNILIAQNYYKENTIDYLATENSTGYLATENPTVYLSAEYSHEIPIENDDTKRVLIETEEQSFSIIIPDEDFANYQSNRGDLISLVKEVVQCCELCNCDIDSGICTDCNGKKITIQLIVQRSND